MAKQSGGKIVFEQKKVLIITGGSLDYQWASHWLANRHYNYCIAADSGLVHADRLQIKVDYILGDYDSVNSRVLERYEKNTETVTYPAEKDYTDTHIAVLTALQQKPDCIDILGATGSRYDHALTNIYIMKLALEQNTECYIYDKHNKIYLLNGKRTIKKEEQYGTYLSFVPMTEEVIITLKGVKYPLEKYRLLQGLSICQSNEISAAQAEIFIEKGVVVAVESKD